MRRDIGNELVVAIVAVGVIAFAVIFGIVLSVSNANQPGAATAQITPVGQTAVSATLRPTVRFTLPVSETPPVVAQATLMPNGTEVIAGLTVTSVAATVTALARDAEALVATETPTETITPSDTPAPTETPTDVPTETHTPTTAPSDTPAPSATSEPTDVPTETRTPTPVPSDTPAPTATFTRTFTATYTPTPTDTFTPTPTFTLTDAPSKTFTPTFTLTFTPSETPTNTFTPTFTPSLTPSNTATFTATFTETPHPTRTPRPTNTPTPTPLPTFTDAPISGTCPLPDGWVNYVVGQADTLYALAVAAGTSVAELRTGNCLEGAETPRAGDTIALPRTPELPIPTFDPAIPETPPGQIGCTDPGALISAPEAGDTVDGVITLTGTARIASFAYYRVEVRPDAAAIFNLYARFETAVTDGELAEINTALYGSGLHWIRLTVVQPNGEFPTPCAIPVIFR